MQVTLASQEHLHNNAYMKEVEKLTSIFKVLSDPNRMSLVTHLCQCRQANVSELSECCSIDFSVVSRHLSKLKDAGVLGARKEGKEVFYDLKASELVKLFRDLADEIEKLSSCCK